MSPDIMCCTTFRKGWPLAALGCSRFSGRPLGWRSGLFAVLARDGELRKRLLCLGLRCWCWLFLRCRLRPSRSGMRSAGILSMRRTFTGRRRSTGWWPTRRKTAVASFNRLGEAYLDAPNPNPFIVFWTYNHPSTQSRAEFAAHYDPSAPGQKPRFFSR